MCFDVLPQSQLQPALSVPASIRVGKGIAQMHGDRAIVGMSQQRVEIAALVAADPPRTDGDLHGEAPSDGVATA